MSLQTRWLISRDFRDVMWIEQATAAEPWTQTDFVRQLKHANCIGVVTESNYATVGFMVYSLRKQAISVIKFAVDPREDFATVGGHMVSRIIDKLSQQRRSEADIHVHESNLDMQLMLHGHGFRCDEIYGDQYLFRYVLRNAVMKAEAT